MLATKILSSIEVESWEVEWRAAETVTVGRVEAMALAAAKIEHNFSVLGATAIEDKLQDDVPDTIADLAAAGIKLWAQKQPKDTKYSFH